MTTTEYLKMIRLPQVMEITGMRETFIRDAMKRGAFPQSVQMGARCTAWVEPEVRQWVRDRIDSQRQAVPSSGRMLAKKGSM